MYNLETIDFCTLCKFLFLSNVIICIYFESLSCFYIIKSCGRDTQTHTPINAIVFMHHFKLFYNFIEI